MAKMLVGTPIRKPRRVRDEEVGKPINYQPGDTVETGGGGLELSAIEVAQYVKDGVLVEPTPAKQTEPPAKGKPAGGK